MSRQGTGVAVLGDAHAAPQGSTDDPEVDRLQSEWERTRRTRLALESQPNRSRNGRGSDGFPNERDLNDDDARLLALETQPVTDPFACLCRPFKFKKIGQSYVLYEKRVVDRGRERRELIIVGPHWVGVVVTLAIVVGCTGLFLLQQCWVLPWYYTAITLAFCSLTLYHLYGVACKDPGIVFPAKPKSKEEMDATENKETTILIHEVGEDVNDFDGSTDGEGSTDAETRRGRARPSVARSSLNPGGSSRPYVPSRYSPRPRFCDICEVSQDAYTEHCDDCGVCIEDYDHHCPWMGKCIGKKNMHAFKMFNMTWVLYVIFVLFASIQNVDWGDVAVQRLHRLSTGEWVPMGTTEKPH